ncbi:hypothetical protein E1288_42445 [Saccharopolyspora elongata]|uniref:Transposase n=1 Tax=Saccharopolyspora elongata TaxID=2530387 RepID=A0A4R4XX09_9PSEU|nr:hypothetical protein E1288_42445 [Saccharopolyspora elongata]
MSRSKKYPPELRERTVRMFAEVRGEHASEWSAIRNGSTTALVAPRLACRISRSTRLRAGPDPAGAGPRAPGDCRGCHQKWCGRPRSRQFLISTLAVRRLGRRPDQP